MLASLKVRLGIESSNTDFDTMLAEFLQSATIRLYPTTAVEVPPQTTTISVDSYGEAIIDLATLSTPVLDVRSSMGVEVLYNGTYMPVNSVFRHGTQLRLRDLDSGTTTARLYGLNQFALTGSDATTTIPTYLQLPVLWYAMSEFFEYLGSNKAKYNIYAQQSGARGVDNMADVSEFYEQRADNYIAEKATQYGA